MNEKRNTVLFVFGGASPEYEVACASAGGLLEAVNRDKYDIEVIGITKNGEWIKTEASPEEIKDGYTWIKSVNNKKAIISADLSDHGIIIFESDGTVTTKHIDLIFPVIHGENGEDGTIQGLFEIAGIPYVGSGVTASSCSMDKAVTRYFADVCSMKQPECFLIDSEDFNKNKKNIVEQVEAFLDKNYPMIVKPSMTGSSIGVSKVENQDELYEAMVIASGYKGKVMVEEFIEGKEIKVAIIENNDIMVGELCEVQVKKGTFNDYDLKYKGQGSHKKIPAQLDENITKKINEEAVKIYKALDCKGFARVDFFLTEDNQIYFNEINTIPGISQKSIFSLMINAIGITYADMIDILIKNELENN